MKNRLAFWIALAWLFSPIVLANASTSEPLKVIIRSTQTGVTNPIVTIGDIADVTGGTSSERKQILKLDLDDLSTSSSTSTLSRAQLEVRLLLAGFDQQDFELQGPLETQVRLTRPADFQDRVEQNLVDEIARQFGVPTADIQVQLLDSKPLQSIQKKIDTSNYSLLAVFPSRLPVGEKKFHVDFMDHHGNRASGRFEARVIVMKNVMVTTSQIPKGTVITADYVQQIKRPLADDQINIANVKTCLGCVAAKDIPQHEILTTNYVTSQANYSRRPLLNRGDIVSVVTSIGPVSVRLKTAKVLTSGSPGDLIQLLNTESNLRFSGIIRDKNTVEVRNQN